MSVQVAVSDPLPAFRRGIMAILDETGYGTETPGDLLAWTQGQQRSVIFLTLQSSEDWRLLDELHSATSDLLVVAVLVDVSTATYVRAVLSGAATAMPRDAPPEVVKRIFEAALNGETVLPLEVVRSLTSSRGLPARETGLPSPREIQWLRELAGGRTVAQLAERAGYSERAMFRLLRDLYARMQVNSRTEALMRAHDEGWL
jgi:DNA-binding NarL/FixJ family response regulator